MTSLKKELVEDMKLAMKNNKDRKASIIRRLKAAIKSEEIKKRKELSDREVVQVMKNEVLHHQEAIENFDCPQETEELKKEIEIIAQYLSPEVIEELNIDNFL